MKLSASLLQAITLGVSLTAVTTTVTSCEKEKIKNKLERHNGGDGGSCPDCPPEPCAACGMG